MDVSGPAGVIENQPSTCDSLRSTSAGECLRDLLDLSARLLRVGGRLVYFLPAAPEVYKEEEVPRHPALRLVANSEQVLTTRYSRRLITMEKVSPPCSSQGKLCAKSWISINFLLSQLGLRIPTLAGMVHGHLSFCVASLTHHLSQWSSV